MGLVSRFVQAAHYRSMQTRRIYWIVLHSTESEGGAFPIANMFRLESPTSPNPTSAHYVVGHDETIQCVQEHDIAWAAPGANAGGIQVEQVGRASWTWDQWEASGVLEPSAALVLDIAQRNGIPLEYVDAEGLLALRPGVTTHAQVTRAAHLATVRKLVTSPFHGVGGSHFDPNWTDEEIGLFLAMTEDRKDTDPCPPPDEAA